MRFQSSLSLAATTMLAFMTFASHASAALLNAATDPLSYHSLILSGASSAVTQALSPACITTLRQELKKKDALLSSTLLSSILPLNKVHFGGADKGVFYHYGQSNLISIGQRGDTEALFQFRIPGTKDGSYTGYEFYVAADPESSKDYGPVQLKIFTKRDAKVFITTELTYWSQSLKKTADPNDFMSQQAGHLSQIQQEIISNDPALASCKDQQIGNPYNLPMLIILALENNNVGLNAYYGTNTPWFQIFGAWAIDHIELGSN